VVRGGGGDAPKELRPDVEIRLGRVCCYGYHSAVAVVSSRPS
jgi:hypothetical protein